VAIKTDDQLDLQSLHRVHERWVMRGTAVINQMRGLLLERGITIRKGRHVEASLPRILEDPENKLSGALRVLLAQLRLRCGPFKKDRGFAAWLGVVPNEYSTRGKQT
jgi:hypothetical protein